MRPLLKTTYKLGRVLCRPRSWTRWPLRVPSISALFCDSVILQSWVFLLLGWGQASRGITLHWLIPDHRVHLYLPKVIYTVFACYQPGDIQVVVKTICGSSFSSYICRQLLSPPGNLAATFFLSVNWEDTCSWVSTLYQKPPGLRTYWQKSEGKVQSIFYLSTI